MNKRYVVRLTDRERERPGKLLSSGTAPARMLTRAASYSRPTPTVPTAPGPTDGSCWRWTPAPPPWGG